MKNTHKRFMVLLLVFVMLLSNLPAAGVLANDGLDAVISPMVATSSELLQMRSYLQTQYNNTTANSYLSANMGYLFALKAINYAIAGTTYSQMDCSKLTYTALKDAYTAKGLASYYVFGSSYINSRAQYNVCASRGLTITESALQTGDLMFWVTPGTTSVTHVGICFKYNGETRIIESLPTTGVGVSKLWNDSNYQLTYYARINKVNTATFMLGSPFSRKIGTQKVLYNCPPSPPTPPTYSGYTFTGWSPSVTVGMTANTTYTARYFNGTVSKGRG